MSKPKECEQGHEVNVGPKIKQTTSIRATNFQVRYNMLYINIVITIVVVKG